MCFAGPIPGIPHVAHALFGGSAVQHLPQSVWGCIDGGWRDDSGFWVHPTAADSAIHLGAATHANARMVTAVDYYSPASKPSGELNAHSNSNMFVRDHSKALLG